MRRSHVKWSLSRSCREFVRELFNGATGWHFTDFVAERKGETEREFACSTFETPKHDYLLPRKFITVYRGFRVGGFNTLITFRGYSYFEIIPLWE